MSHTNTRTHTHARTHTHTHTHKTSRVSRTITRLAWHVVLDELIIAFSFLISFSSSFCFGSNYSSVFKRTSKTCAVPCTNVSGSLISHAAVAALAIRAGGRGRSITYPSWLALVQTGKFNLRQWPCCHFRSDCIWHATLYPVYRIQPVVQPIVKPVEQPVEQLAALCKQTFNRLSNRLFNRFDNRLYRVNGVLESHEHHKPVCSSKMSKNSFCV